MSTTTMAESELAFSRAPKKSDVPVLGQLELDIELEAPLDERVSKLARGIKPKVKPKPKPSRAVVHERPTVVFD